MVSNKQLDWTTEQRAAVETIASWCKDRSAPRFMSLTGPAGAGKTSVLNAVRPFLGRRVAWSALTGKAAARMREASDVPARTLHSTLYHPPIEVMGERGRVDLRFDHVREIDDGKVLVVDESSMMSPRVFEDVKRSGFDKILLVGDPYQIPPVLSAAEERQLGGDYSVFREVTGPFLPTVMRSSGAVLQAATIVREQQQIPRTNLVDGGTQYDFISCSIEDAAGLALSEWYEDQGDHVLITWTNAARNHANEIARKVLGLTDPYPVKGEPVVAYRNAHRAGVMNGDMLEVVEWHEKGPTIVGIETRWLEVKTPLGDMMNILVSVSDEVSLFSGDLPSRRPNEISDACADAGVELVPVAYGYCLTCHKSQGSEYRRATTFLPGDLRNWCFRKNTLLPSGESMPFSMRWLYTAISRACKRSTLVIGE